MSAWSSQVFGRRDANTPVVMPTTRVKASAYSDSDSVTGRRSTMARETLRPRRIESPRSPRAMPWYQLTSWTSMGRSRPSSCRTRSTSCGVAPSPAMIDAGSPGTICMMKNETRVTRKSTGTARRIRRRM